MKITVYFWKETDYFVEVLNNLTKEFPEIEIKTYFTKNTKDYSDSEIVLAVDMTMEEAEKAQKLKALFVPYTGLDDFPEDYLKNRGIKIYNSYAKSKYVAERAVTLALGIMGKVTEYDRDMRKGQWGPKTGNKNRWETLFGKKCALLGVGHIGQNIAKLLSPFTEEIYTLDRGKRYPGIKKYFNTLEELAKSCDVFFISLPLNDKTYNIVDKNILDKLNGKYFINVGRGKTVEEKALYDALNNRVLKGAGIEVWYDYPSPEKKQCYPSLYPFHKLDNIIMSPHIATFVKEDVWAYFDDTIEQLKRYLLELRRSEK